MEAIFPAGTGQKTRGKIPQLSTLKPLGNYQICQFPAGLLTQAPMPFEIENIRWETTGYD
jgi:hypothetical protein